MVNCMIDKATAITTIMNRLKKLPTGHAIDLRTYKRNRSVLIARVGNDEFDVVERGFEEARFLVSRDKLKKLLKMLMKREFPRSTKIRLYDLGEYSADIHLQRKTL
ncbi:hypothetical protein GM415_08315 [Pseudodesulfovibrio cashew]|uniref:Uncharacterized protein n=1 Tax=Pseudodesulfovibrio cashew TaxID=2678688 RepID=A0A6I6JG41_9BACT|nr:hypothetical protein [Pseudodesulfovibrio cashew]QGY40129.1 hypothetical protein GM415_08315 [Pseudodesulfovibrio cashew]